LDLDVYSLFIWVFFPPLLEVVVLKLGLLFLGIGFEGFSGELEGWRGITLGYLILDLRKLYCLLTQFILCFGTASRIYITELGKDNNSLTTLG